jgi:hypothetical protein
MPSDLLAVLQALDRLSPKQRASVVLHHYAGYPVKGGVRDREQRLHTLTATPWIRRTAVLRSGGS